MDCKVPDEEDKKNESLLRCYNPFFIQAHPLQRRFIKLRL